VVPQNVTIYEVAQAAGVSISTVSNALNRPDRVAEETRSRVLEVAHALGYVPKAEAMSFARKAMRRIGVLGPFNAYESYLRRLKGILSEASALGIEVSVFDHESAATSSSPFLASLPIQGQFDGLIVMGKRIEDTIEQRLLERGVPTVLVDADSERFSVVACDDVSGGRLAARYLHGLGHRTFGYVVERQVSEYDSQAQRRLAGFRSQLHDLGNCNLTVIESEPSVLAARDAVRELLSGPDRPQAVISHFDDIAVGVLLAARDLGLEVPSDLAVMGYDDSAMAVATNMTTIRQPFEESGSLATRVLMATIDSPGIPRTTTYLDAAVVQRATTAQQPPARRPRVARARAT
jgi:DNA-binding LacI/PurR family transcriptional regulator